MPAAGNYNGDFNDAGSYGYYWSGTPNDDDNAYNLNFNDSNANVNNANRDNGFLPLVAE